MGAVRGGIKKHCRASISEAHCAGCAFKKPFIRRNALRLLTPYHVFLMPPRTAPILPSGTASLERRTGVGPQASRYAECD